MQQKQYAVTRPLWHEGHTEECCRLRQVHCTLKSARQSVFTERTVTHKNGMSTTQHATQRTSLGGAVVQRYVLGHATVAAKGL